MSVTIHSAQDFIKMRAAGKLAAEILDFITPYVKVGATTDSLNKLCHDKIIENGAIPAPLNYKGFLKSICTSINHVVTVQPSCLLKMVSYLPALIIGSTVKNIPSSKTMPAPFLP